MTDDSDLYEKTARNVECRQVNAVPIEELEALADGWEEQAEMEAAPEQWTFNNCARDVRSLLQEYRGESNE